MSPDYFANFFNGLDNFLWSYLAAPLILMAGIALTIRLKFLQFRQLPQVFTSFCQAWQYDTACQGIRPIYAFFASIGGCIGIGNLVAVCAAVQIGGPGALFWIWVAALFGMLIKYAEVYLSIVYRERNAQGGYDGGPLVYLRHALGPAFATLFMGLWVIYGTEIFMFKVVTQTVAENFVWAEEWVAVTVMSAVVLATLGGAKRVGQISAILVPIFIVAFLVMSGVVLWHNRTQIWPCVQLVLQSAFQGHAAIGGFAGSSVLLTLSQGMARGCYSGDIGVGYAGIIHSEAATNAPQRQAQLAIFGIILDTFIVCTLSIMVILVTEVWTQPISAEKLLQTAFAQYFPATPYFMAGFMFLVGFSSIIAYFLVGLKCARRLAPKWGGRLFYLYGAAALCGFSQLDLNLTLSVMGSVGGILLLINMLGLVKLWRKIQAAKPVPPLETMAEQELPVVT